MGTTPIPQHAVVALLDYLGPELREIAGQTCVMAPLVCDIQTHGPQKYHHTEIPRIAALCWTMSNEFISAIHPMTFMEAHGSAMQFRGWFPTTAFHMLLADRGWEPSRENLSLIVSTMQVFPIAPGTDPYVAVPMFQALTLQEGTSTYTFISLHPSLNMYI